MIMFRKKLKPCPFCGGEAIIREKMGHYYISAVHTKRCGMKPDTWLISSEPLCRQIKAWNLRSYGCSSVMKCEPGEYMGHKVRIWETGPYYGREGLVLDWCTDISNTDNAYYIYYTIGFNETNKPSFVPDHKFLYEDLEVIDL